ADLFRVARTHENDEGGAVDDAAHGKALPAVPGDHAGLRELFSVELEREESQLRRNAQEDLIGDGARTGEGADDLDMLACAGAPLALELGEDSMIDHVSQDAESVEDERSRWTCGAGQRSP